MYKRIKAAREQESGFTLIELLIVIVILGILAAIVVFSVQGITDRGTTSACKADKATVTTAGEAYYAKKGSYATGIGAVGDTAASNTLIGGGFLHDAPSGTGYSITYATTANGFTVGPATCP
jgi:general secretion pathway protein G